MVGICSARLRLDLQALITERDIVISSTPSHLVRPPALLVLMQRPKQDCQDLDPVHEPYGGAGTGEWAQDRFQCSTHLHTLNIHNKMYYQNYNFS